MNMQAVTRHLPKRLCILGTVATLAFGLAIPLTANAAPATAQATGCSGSLSCLITWGNAHIALRLTALNALSGKVNDRLSDHSITSDQAAAIQADITTNINNMNTQKSKIDADTTAAQALADDKSIFTTYRIFAAVLPHDYRWLLFDILQNVDSKLHSLVPTIQDAINGAPSSIQGQLNTLFTDYKSQLAAAAKRTLELIDASGWEAVFGKTEKQEKAARIEVLRRAAAVAAPSRPWLPKA